MLGCGWKYIFTSGMACGGCLSSSVIYGENHDESGGWNPISPL
jgi:hypothetical protein